MQTFNWRHLLFVFLAIICLKDASGRHIFRRHHHLFKYRERQTTRDPTMTTSTGFTHEML